MSNYQAWPNPCTPHVGIRHALSNNSHPWSVLSPIVSVCQSSSRGAHAGCTTHSALHRRRIVMEQISVRLAVLLLIGVLVVALTLHAPVIGSAVVAATTVVALLAQLIAGD